MWEDVLVEGEVHSPRPSVGSYYLDVTSRKVMAACEMMGGDGDLPGGNEDLPGG